MQDQLPDVKNFLPMPAVKPPKTETKTMTNAIEQTKRALYACLDKVRRAAKHRVLTAELEERLEEYLEELRIDRVRLTENRRDDLERKLAAMTEDRDQILQRLHAIDHAYNEQSKAENPLAAQFEVQVKTILCQEKTIENLKSANKAAGEELMRVQAIARQQLDDVRSAEKLSDELSDKLTQATTVIGQQEQLIIAQRLAIADLYMAKGRGNTTVVNNLSTAN